MINDDKLMGLNIDSVIKTLKDEGFILNTIECRMRRELDGDIVKEIPITYASLSTMRGRAYELTAENDVIIRASYNE